MRSKRHPSVEYPNWFGALTAEFWGPDLDDLSRVMVWQKAASLWREENPRMDWYVFCEIGRDVSLTDVVPPDAEFIAEARKRANR